MMEDNQMRRRRFRLWVLLFLAVMTFSAGAQEVIFSTSNSFAPGDQIGEDGAFRDTYSVRVRAGTTIEVVCRSDDVDTYIEAVLPGGEQVANDDYDGYHAGFIRSIGTTGTMEFSVSPLFGEEEGEYRVTVTELGAAEVLEPGETVRGSLSSGTSPAVAGRYEYRGRAGQRVVIDLESDDFDAYLRVTDETGREYTNDDGGDGFNSRLSYQFETDGAIQIVAGSIGGSNEGAYTLKVAESAQSVAAEYRGSLDLNDSRGYDGTIYDSYEYVGRSGRQISVLLESDDFDTVVYISNPDGSNLARDDDGGGGTNSAVDVTLPENGTYTIYVVSFFEETGAYSLTVFE
jgi:hypothetical protein